MKRSCEITADYRTVRYTNSLEILHARARRARLVCEVNEIVRIVTSTVRLYATRDDKHQIRLLKRGSWPERGPGDGRAGITLRRVPALGQDPVCAEAPQRRVQQPGSR